VYYHFAKFLFVNDPDQMREAHGKAVRCLTDALPYLDPPGKRVEIPFDGSAMVGILREPHGRGPHPVMIMIPGLDSAKEELRSTEELFLERGIATFSVDGPGQGEAEYRLTIRPDWEVPGAAILDALAAQPGIDPERIGLWGVSLGGYYAPRVASGDPRVRACVALCGPWCLGDLWPQLPQLTREAFTARSGAEDERDAIERARQLTLAGRTGRLTMPLLIVAGRQDRIFPWQDAARLRDSVPGPAELLLLDEGNHGCANMPYRHRPYAADWMARQLAG
jgi:2,6-dihydroxypseudooxynicotine hydrolase